jgi:hypothetical protein
MLAVMNCLYSEPFSHGHEWIIAHERELDCARKTDLERSGFYAEAGDS